MKRKNSSIGIIYQLGGLSCMILIVYSLITMLIMVGIGPPPETIEECFSMLKENRLNGLLRLDLAHIIIGFFLPTAGNILMAIAGPLYLLWFPLVGIRLFKLKVKNEL